MRVVTEAAAASLMDRFWPGPLTLVFKASSGLPEFCHGSNGTVALRNSSSDVSTRLLAAIGGPITSTSANRSGEAPARSAGEAADIFSRDDVDLVLDGGLLADSLPSTLVDVSTGTPSLLREGAVPVSELHDFLK